MTQTAPANPTRPIPGPRGYPIVGVLPDFTRDIFGFMLKAQRRYGDLVELNFGRRSMLLATHPDMLRRMLVDNVRNYSKPYGDMRRILGNGLVISEGSFWLRQRRLMQPSFHHQRIAALAAVMVEEAAALREQWQGLARAGKLIDLYAEMGRLTQRIVVRTMFSTDVGDDAEQVGAAFAMTIDYMERRQFQAVRLPLDWPTPENRRFTAAIDYLDRKVYGLIEARRRSGERPDDLLSMLIEAEDAETGERMTDQQIRDEVMTIYLAGHETTAIVLTWAFHVLVHHPEIERRLREEYAAVLGGRTPGAADVAQLHYARRFFDEVMRLYPPTWMLTRRAEAADELGGYQIPAGTTLLISTYATHRHPAFWPNPEAFDPERFTPEASAGRHKFAYFPFLSGPRQCIGNTFALVEMQLALATLLQGLRLSAIPGYPVRPVPRATLRPSGPVWMQLEQV